jgi:hypothetical protein
MQGWSIRCDELRSKSSGEEGWARRSREEIDKVNDVND